MKDKARELRDAGWGVIPPREYLSDMEDEFKSLWERVKPYTLISVERGYSIYKSILYIEERCIPGDFVECGVWKGGSCLLMALTLESIGAGDRKIYLYDTFKGMTRPTEEDVIAWNNKGVIERWENNDFDDWAVSRESVESVLLSEVKSGDVFVFVEGDVLKTLQKRYPEKIALLRLDTDWYESTAMELKVLYPLLSTGGVLLIDDYGHFKGARKAVDEYFKGEPILLSRVDYTGRQGVKG